MLRTTRIPANLKTNQKQRTQNLVLSYTYGHSNKFIVEDKIGKGFKNGHGQ